MKMRKSEKDESVLKFCQTCEKETHAIKVSNKFICTECFFEISHKMEEKK